MLISCIIPTRNRPEFLGKAVASVLAQSHSMLELIVVNDGVAPVALFKDARMTVIDSQQSGAVAARNLGLATARGEAIAWLDDDDVWTDVDFLHRCVGLFKSSSDFIFADGDLVLPDGTRKVFTRSADVETLKQDNTILVSAICYRRILHEQLGSFDASLPYYWDWDWYLRVARHQNVMTHLNDSVVDIRIHDQNMSGQANLIARLDNLKLLSNKHGLGEIQLKSHRDFV